MQLSVLGIDHHTAPVGLREKAAVRAGQIGEILAVLKPRLGAGVLLSTCNRTEIYTMENGGGAAAGYDFLEDYLGMARADFAGYAYRYTDRDAAGHLFRVAGGLDSMIIGEYEVLGQVRQALAAAEAAGMVNLPLRRVFQDAVRTGRLVREETGISQNALSVSSVAMELAADVVGDLSRARVLVIGAGEAGRLVARAAQERGARRIRVASRTLARAAALAGALGGTSVSFEDIVPEVGASDLVITCADAPHYILTSSRLEQAMSRRNGFPLVIIDIAVPRNVEPGAGEMERVFVYNIDDLNDIAEKNRRAREGEKVRAERLIEAEVDKFARWWHDYSVRPVVRALMEKANRIRTVNLSKALKKLPPLSEEELHNLDRMTEAIVARLLKEPIRLLKSDTASNGEYARMVSQLFQLEGEEPD